MKNFSTAGRYYLALCLAASGYFCTAAISGWPGQGLGFEPGGGSSHSSGSSYWYGSSGGRSSGGFGGGGK